MSKKIIIANWKMNPLTFVEAEKLAKASDKDGIVLCAPFVFLNELKKVLKKAKLGAQDAFFGDVGAFTGEISAKMLKNLGIEYVILGHSEKRALGENNDLVNKKLKAVLDLKITPILCVGEKERDENHEYINIVREQILECLANIKKEALSKIIIAYEPVWAIGKNALRGATAEEFLEMSIFIKKILSDKFGIKIKLPKIIYGGSVNSQNALSFLEQGNTDGFLIGGASLDAKKFNEIIKICEALNK